MNKSFCEQIDRDSLVEEYVRGKLQGELRTQFEAHLRECERHAQAVLLEKSLRNGVIEFARGQIRATIRRERRPQEDVRYAILRYAAFLFVAVVVPLMLYYQFGVFQPSAGQKRVLPPPTTIADSLAAGTGRADEESATPASRKTTTGRPSEITPEFSHTATSGGAGEIVTAEPGYAPAPDVKTGTVIEDKLPSAPIATDVDQKSLSRAKKIETPVLLQTEVQDEAVAKPAQLAAEVAASATKEFEHEPAMEQAKKEQISPLGAIQSDADSMPSVIVTANRAVIRRDVTPAGTDEIVSRTPELANCLTPADTACFVTVQFIITTGGRVEKLKITDSNLPNKATEECIGEKIRRWQFKTREQQTNINQRIYLKP
jgi:hypothetical protein